VYYPTDIRNALLAAEQAVGATADASGNKDDPFTAGFLTGYRAALTTLALAFGLAAYRDTPSEDWKPVLLATVSPSLRRR
jgi:hypothetical protein